MELHAKAEQLITDCHRLIDTNCCVFDLQKKKKQKYLQSASVNKSLLERPGLPSHSHDLFINTANPSADANFGRTARLAGVNLFYRFMNFSARISILMFIKNAQQQATQFPKQILKLLSPNS